MPVVPVQRRRRIAGGAPGYAEFVRAMANPDPEHDNLVEWIGTDAWDPLAFDTIEINDRLAEIKV